MTAVHPFEVEQKFRVAAFEAVRERLVELGAYFAPPIEQSDTYYSHPARNFAQTDEALRLRRVGEANCITYKGPKIDAQTKTRRELELPLPAGTAAFEQYAELLRTLGFGEMATVHKWREPVSLTWEAHEVAVALDTVEGVGQFMELEIAADAGGLPAARQAIGSLAKKLGLTGSERRSYLELLIGPSP